MPLHAPDRSTVPRSAETRANDPSPPRRGRSLTRAAFYAHLWLGVVFTIALVAISITGILLNHKRGLGLMPDVPHEPDRAFSESLPLAQLAQVAVDTVTLAGGANGEALDPVRAIDRMDVRPRDGFVKVRMRDAASTEVTVDLASGRVLHVGPRGDVFLEKLHSGEIFGGLRWVLLSDAAAIALVVTLVTGYWLWLLPKLAHRRNPPGNIADREGDV